MTDIGLIYEKFIDGVIVDAKFPPLGIHAFARKVWVSEAGTIEFADINHEDAWVSADD